MNKVRRLKGLGSGQTVRNFHVVKIGMEKVG